MTTTTTITVLRRYRFLRESGGASRRTARRNVERFAEKILDATVESVAS